MAATIVPSVIRRFARQYPRAIVHVDEVGSPAQVAGLRERKYDFTITRTQELPTDELDDLNSEILFHDELVVAAGARSRWARRRHIGLPELVHERWIVAPAYSWNYTRLLEAFRASGLSMPSAGFAHVCIPVGR